MIEQFLRAWAAGDGAALLALADWLEEERGTPAQPLRVFVRAGSDRQGIEWLGEKKLLRVSEVADMAPWLWAASFVRFLERAAGARAWARQAGRDFQVSFHDGARARDFARAAGARLRTCDGLHVCAIPEASRRRAWLGLTQAGWGASPAGAR